MYVKKCRCGGTGAEVQVQRCRCRGAGAEVQRSRDAGAEVQIQYLAGHNASPRSIHSDKGVLEEPANDKG